MTKSNPTTLSYALYGLSDLFSDQNFNSSEFPDEPIEELLTLTFSTYPASIEMGGPLDGLHEDTHKRLKYLASLDKYQVLGLLLSDSGYFYTSTNMLLKDRLMNDIRSGKYIINKKTITNPLELLEQLHFFDHDITKSRIRNLVVRLINYDILIKPKGIFTQEQAQKPFNIFLEPLRNLKIDDEYIYLLGNAVEEITRSKFKSQIQSEIASDIQWATDEKIKRELYFILYYLNQSTNLIPGKDKQQIKHLMQDRMLFNPNDFKTGNEFIIVMVFDPEGTEGKEGHWQSSKRIELSKYRQYITGIEGDRNADTGILTITGSNKDRKFRIIMMRNDPEQNVNDLSDTIQRYPKGFYIFRGHSYKLDDDFPSDIFSKNNAKSILFFPGSCGSSGAIPSYINKNPSIKSFISNKRSGRGMVNLAITNILLEHYINKDTTQSYRSILQSQQERIESNGNRLDDIAFVRAGEMAVMYGTGEI